MNLYQKYRPISFSEMVGNEEQIKSLENIFTKINHSHVFIFTGPSGCGKTTAARICSNLLFADIIEINSADNRGIDTAREIIDQMKIKPLSGRNIAFIIDEAHKCTNDFFNAMLKPLEDTPEHIYFFICTTDPQKIIKTFLNRCTEYVFNFLSDVDIGTILNKIISEENLNIDSEVFYEIVNNCNGIPRNAIILLEKIIGLDNQCAIKLIQNWIDYDIDIRNLCSGILNKNLSWLDCCNLIKKINDIDIEKVRYSIINYMGSVLLNGKQNDTAAQVIYNLRDPLYNIGKSGLILALYQIFFP